MKKKIFIDMDGTIVKWIPSTIEEVASRGYFRNLPVVQNVLNMVSILIGNPEYEVYILSSVFKDGHSAGDKMYWLHQNLPEIADENVIFVPYGKVKADYINTVINQDCYLLDDLSKNLHEWERAGGTGIKIYNGINGTKGTWKGFNIKYDMNVFTMYKQICGIMAA